MASSANPTSSTEMLRASFQFSPDQLPGEGELDPDLLVDLVIIGLVELLGVVTLAMGVWDSCCLDDVDERRSHPVS